jgi:hypothetical protein
LCGYSSSSPALCVCTMDLWASEIKKGQLEVVKIPSGMHLHLSGASLGPTAAEGERVFLECDIDGAKVILCCLCAGKTDNVPLDHWISSHHESVTFTTIGKEGSDTSIHLSGYIDVEEEPDDYEEVDDEDVDENMMYFMNGGNYGYSEDEEGEDEEDEGDEEEYDDDDNDSEKDELAPMLIPVDKPHPRFEEIEEEQVNSKSKATKKNKGEVQPRAQERKPQPAPKEKADNKQKKEKQKTQGVKPAQGGNDSAKTKKKGVENAQVKVDKKKRPQESQPSPTSAPANKKAKVDHQKNKANESNDAKKLKTPQCDICNRTFNSLQGLSQHNSDKHKKKK